MVANNPVKILAKASNVGSAAATKNPRAALAATHELIEFATTGGGIKVVENYRCILRYKEELSLHQSNDSDCNYNTSYNHNHH